MAETKESKRRTFQVLATALLEEKRIGLLTQDEFEKKLSDLYEVAYGTTTKPTETP